MSKDRRPTLILGLGTLFVLAIVTGAGVGLYVSVSALLDRLHY